MSSKQWCLLFKETHRLVSVMDVGIIFPLLLIHRYKLYIFSWRLSPRIELCSCKFRASLIADFRYILTLVVLEWCYNRHIHPETSEHVGMNEGTEGNEGIGKPRTSASELTLHIRSSQLSSHTGVESVVLIWWDEHTSTRMRGGRWMKSAKSRYWFLDHGIIWTLILLTFVAILPWITSESLGSGRIFLIWTGLLHNTPTYHSFSLLQTYFHPGMT